MTLPTHLEISHLFLDSVDVGLRVSSLHRFDQVVHLLFHVLSPCDIIFLFLRQMGIV